MMPVTMMLTTKSLVDISVMVLTCRMIPECHVRTLMPRFNVTSMQDGSTFGHPEVEYINEMLQGICSGPLA